MTFPTTLPPELHRALTIITDYFTDAEIPHVIESTEENPLVYVVATFCDGYINSGFVGWRKDTASVEYIAMNSEAITRAELEGIDDPDVKAGWDAHDLDGFILFLNGTVRTLVSEQRAARIAAENLSENGGETAFSA